MAGAMSKLVELFARAGALKLSNEPDTAKT